MMDIKLETDTLAVCRICLQSSEEGEEMASIFDQDTDSVFLYEKIESCGGITILAEPELPTCICKKCNVFLTIAYKFRIICKNSDNYLREFVRTSAGVLHDLEEPDHNNINETQSEYYSEIDVPEEDLIAGDDEDSFQSHQSPPPKKSNPSSSEKTLDITSSDATPIRAQNERRLDKEKQIFICDICGNVYPRKYALEAHMRRHRNERPYECEICPKSFHLISQLTRHIRKHAGVRPYACQYCKRTFARRCSMLEHERIHRNERPFTCDICGKSFTYSGVLKVHKLTHTGEKPFICGICGKRFSRGHHLRAHLETLLHQKDPRSKILLKQIKREEDLSNIYEELLNV